MLNPKQDTAVQPYEDYRTGDADKMKRAEDWQKLDNEGKKLGKEESDTKLYSVLINSQDPAERKRAADMLMFRRALPEERGQGKLAERTADVQTAGALESEKGKGEADAELRKAAPKARNTLNALNEQWKIVDTSIDEAIKMISPYTAGVGSWLKGIPATPQKNLATKLETIQANVGFDKLQQMRMDSPSGGALGQVSDFENRLLQAVKGSMDQAQSPAQLKANLETIKRDLATLREMKKMAYDIDYSKYGNGDQKKDSLGIR